MQAILKSAMVMMIAAVVTGCPENNGDPFIGGDDATAKSAQVNAAYTIAISVPQTNAITQLEGEAAGFYSVVGAAIVTDRNGNPAPDGTIVHLDAIDTIIATGTADSMTGTAFSDSAPTLADGTGTSFTTAAVSRDGAQRFIQKDDLVLIVDGADSVDKNQVVANNPSSMTSLDVTRTYSRTYPSSVYTTSSYVIGQSLMGVSLVGVDEGGTKTPGIAKTKDGIAGFRMEYPANNRTIHLGCSGVPAIDTRFSPVGSADVYVVARLDDHRVTTISDQFCFYSMLDVSLTAVPTDLSATGSVTLTAKDDGGIALPYTTLTPSVAIDGTLAVTASSCTTVALTGRCVSTITVAGGASGDSATVTYTDSSGTGTAEVTVTVP